MLELATEEMLWIAEDWAAAILEVTEARVELPPAIMELVAFTSIGSVVSKQ